MKPSLSPTLNLEFNEYAETGVWTFDYLYLQDQTLNIEYYYPYDFNNPPEISVSSGNDTTAPQLDSYSFSSTNVDTSDPLQRSLDVYLTNLTDDLSGVRQGNIYYRSPSGSQTVGAIFLQMIVKFFQYLYFKS